MIHPEQTPATSPVGAFSGTPEHAPDITLIYESGAIGTTPDILPLLIGDGELCNTAMTTVSVPGMFRYWFQGGHITTVIGDCDRPKTRLPGGGAPEIAGLSQKVFVTMKQSRRGMVEKIDFFTGFGHGEGGDHRRRMGLSTAGPAALITDPAVWKPDPESGEMTVTSLHPGVGRDLVRECCGWSVAFADEIGETALPTQQELDVLRGLKARTAAAHAAG